ncbi:MAG: ATP synthase F1 subunit delta [Fimbriimonadales bacterium]|nr:ATP synthase F1 subunit delta [Fimbriimonadales bacterium]
MDARAALRYARALLAAAQKAGVITEVEQDLEAIVAILDAKPEFKQTLESPKVTRDKKLALIDRIFADRARPLTVRLLRLLVEKNREDDFALIAKEYVRLREEAEGILHVHISSAAPLSQDQVDRIVKKIESQTGKRVVYDLDVDPTKIGGVTARYGDNVLDGSVSGALRRLREKLYIDVLKQA